MGSTIYCKICRIPIKLFDSDILACSHNIKYADSKIFYYPSDSTDGISLWNRHHPERLMNLGMRWGVQLSPYRMTELALFLMEAEEIINGK